ncbi:MAG: hypothetical protein Fues2KO_28460 [Fuerstiella sp.]
MFVLSRTSGQQILIGDSILVKVLRIRGDTVRIGIDAPLELQVARLQLPHHPTTTMHIPMEHRPFVYDTRNF